MKFINKIIAMFEKNERLIRHYQRLIIISNHPSVFIIF